MEGIVRINIGRSLVFWSSWNVFILSSLRDFGFLGLPSLSLLWGLLVIVVKLWQDWDFPLLLSGGFNVGDFEIIGSFSTMFKFCMDPVVWWSEPVGLWRGVGRGVIDRKPEPPTATVLLENQDYLKFNFGHFEKVEHIRFWNTHAEGKSLTGPKLHKANYKKYITILKHHRSFKGKHL